MNRRALRLGAVAVSALLLGACATAPPPRRVVVPVRGQSPAELDRDQFECALDAQDAAGSGAGTSLRNGAILGIIVLGSVGSALGAVIGAASGAAGHGATVGAIFGGTAGGIAGGSIAFARDRNTLRRLTDACLEARGYTVGVESGGTP
jgi:hypothetical protein